jgi:type I restriction enzyme M protein|tara:strand:- start:38 stop:274 length:237 start_codon:yes stop_codon:yes gene_type:complete
MPINTNNLATQSWAIADLLRGDFKESQYGRINLPFNLLRRLECVLEETKPAVLVEYERVQKMGISEEAQEIAVYIESS